MTKKGHFMAFYGLWFGMSMITMSTTLIRQREKIFRGKCISWKLFQGNSFKEFCQKDFSEIRMFHGNFSGKSKSFKGKKL